MTRDGTVQGDLTTIVRTELAWLGTLRARAGVLSTPNTLLYVTGGLAFGQVKSSTAVTSSFLGANVCDAVPICSAGAASETQYGWTMGAGVETAFARGWSLKLEYLYFDLGDVSYTGRVPAGSLPPAVGLPTLDTTTEVDGHIGRAGLNYKF